VLSVPHRAPFATASSRLSRSSRWIDPLFPRLPPWPPRLLGALCVPALLRSKLLFLLLPPWSPWSPWSPWFNSEPRPLAVRGPSLRTRTLGSAAHRGCPFALFALDQFPSFPATLRGLRALGTCPSPIRVYPRPHCSPRTCLPSPSHPLTLSPSHPLTLSPSHPLTPSPFLTPLCSPPLPLLALCSLFSPYPFA
jgi:hypothetical protein